VNYLKILLCILTFPSNRMLEVVLEELFEFPVPNLEDIEEYPEVNELDPDIVGKPSDAEDENIGGKDTGCPEITKKLKQL